MIPSLLKRFTTLLKWLLGITLFSSLLYISVAYVLSLIPVNKKSVHGDITIYILSNGVHTDIVLPAKTKTIDWTQHIQFSHTQQQDSTNLNYLAFGWGDKGFYLNTPTWSDLTFSTAFKAAFGLSSSAMHCTYYSRLLENEHCKSVTISEKEFNIMVELIRDSFQWENNHPILIPNNYYGHHDAFYEAKGTYSFFNTCNSWANTILKESNQRACIWTPVDWGILNKY